MKLAASVCLTIFLAVTVSSDPVKMNNIGKFYQGYNIFNGNPLSTQNGGDPGFTGSLLFSFSYSKNIQTADGRYLVPDGVNLDREETYKLDFSTTEITGEKSYSNTLSSMVEVTGEYMSASFSASVDYKNVQKRSSSSQTVHTITSGECSVYRVTQDSANPPQLSSGLIDEVLDFLPDVYDESTKEEYFAFIDNYGTHFITDLHMGARYSNINSLSAEDWKTLETTGVSVKAAAKYSLLVSVGISTTTTSEKEKANQYSKKVSSTSVSSIGSKPPADGNIHTWVGTAVSEPMPIRYQLKLIHELLTPRYFNLRRSSRSDAKAGFNVDDYGGFDAVSKRLANVRENVKKTLSNYCEYLKGKGRVASCAAPGPDKSLPSLKTVNNCKFCARSCGGDYPVEGGVMSAGHNWVKFFGGNDEGCVGPIAQRRSLENKGMKLCCPVETERKVGQCRLCSSCGADFPYWEGAVQVDESSERYPGWTWAFDNDCGGNLRDRFYRAESRTGFPLCCNQPKVCSLCMSCGGDYPHESALILTDAKRERRGFIRARPDRCQGDPIAGQVPEDGIKLCCSSRDI